MDKRRAKKSGDTKKLKSWNFFVLRVRKDKKILRTSSEPNRKRKTKKVARGESRWNIKTAKIGEQRRLQQP